MPERKRRIFGLIMAFKRGFAQRMRRSGSEDLQSMLRTATLFYVKMESPSMKKLSTYLAIRPPSATALVRSMEKTSLLKRVRDPQDRRSFRLKLTTKGERALQEKQKILEECMGEVLSPLSPKEQDEFIAILEKITNV